MKNILYNLIRIIFVIGLITTLASCEDEEDTIIFNNTSAPSDLSVDIEVSGDFDEMITVTPKAQNVTQFEVYFGEDEEEESETISIGESATHTYESFGEYLIKVVAFGSTGLTSEFVASIEGGEIIIIEEPVDAILELPIDHESIELEYAWGGFGNANPEVVTNPDASGNNTSATVLEINKATGAEVWAGSSLRLDTVVDFSETSNISLNVWSPRAGVPILFKIENADASLSAEVQSVTTVAEAWETLVFDMSTSTVGIFDINTEYTTVIVFPDFGNVGVDENFYFDDIQNTNETSMGGGTSGALLDFETEITNEFGGFGNANPAIITNPDVSGINTSTTVLEIDKTAGAEVWAGISLLLDGSVDFSTSALVTLKFWSPKADTPILLKFENIDNSASIEVEAMSTLANSWEEITIDMSTSTNMALDETVDYARIVLFADFGNVGNGEQFYFDDIDFSLKEGSSEDMSNTVLPQLPLDFESSEISYELEGFGNANPLLVVNPDASGINTSATVLEIDKLEGAEVWAGIALPLDGAVDFSSSTLITFKYWSPRAGTIALVKFENAGNSASVEVPVTSTLANTWEELTVDMSTSTVGSFDANEAYEKIVLFADFGATGNGEKFYFDDITLN